MGLTQPVDSSILHEIVRIVDARRKVPERVVVRGREYQITYLEDHQRRLEEALQRFDHDRLNMLYGQLASKVKYQMLRRVPQAAPKAEVKKAAKSAARPAKARTAAPAKAKSARKARPAAKSAHKARPAATIAARTKSKTVKTTRPAQGKKAAMRRGRAARKGTAKKK
jgi:hypothetical protein